MPDVMFSNVTYPNSGGTPVTETYYVRPIWAFGYSHYAPGYQQATLGYGVPILPPHRLDVGYLFMDLTGMDSWPSAYAYQPVIPFLINSDDIHIKAGKIRFGSLPAVQETFISTNVNSPGGEPYRNAVWENLNVEYSGRKGIQLYTAGTTDAGWTSMQFRNFAIEPRAATHMPGNPSPGGISSLLGLWRFIETVRAEPPPIIVYDGRNVDFTAAGDLTGDYIDITPPDPGAPVFRIWFQVAGSGSAPSGSGVTLIQATAASASAAVLALAFSTAIQGNASAASYLTAATFNTVAVIGSFSYYREQATGGYVGANVASASGVTTVLRSHRRNWEPDVIGFERFVAADPIYSNLINIYADIGAHRDIYFTFKDCVLGAYQAAVPTVASNGSFAGSANTVKDQLHFAYEDTILDIRDGFGPTTLDLLLYSGRFRNCRVRTASGATGVVSMGAGYETLVSEQSGVYAVTPGTTPGSTSTTIDIPTKLFWMPKDGNVRIYPADAATAVVWNTNMPYVEWRKSARPVGTTSSAMVGSYYTSTDDRRAPVLRLNFASALAASPLNIGWAAAVSP
jgi:hypothetical protein